MGKSEAFVATVPLLQTALWVALIVWVLRRHNEPISRAINALLTRIESGSTLKMGAVEFGEKIEASSPADQKAEAEEEVAEYIEDNKENSDTIKPIQLNIKTEAAVAEDLALRALQVEFDQFVRRHAKISNSYHADGIIEIDGNYILVEVKLVSRKSLLRVVKRTAIQTQGIIAKENWKYMSIILCLVLVDGSLCDRDRIAISKELEGYPLKMDYRLYEIEALREEFGVIGENR